MRNPVQRYDWGSVEAIPRLRGMELDGEPQAELWMGSHPNASSEIEVEGRWVSLKEHLGDGGLPFLFKVLAAERGLSIQAHPNLEQARVGFARENAAGLDVRSALRTYRDANHKPELLCALEDFYGMVGFRRDEELRAELRELLPDLRRDARIADLADAVETYCAGGELRGWFDRYLRLVDETAETARSVFVGAVARYARERCASDGDESAVRKSRYWWVLELLRQFPLDPGCAAPLYLNVVHLKPGEAIFVDAGTLHAYLHGLGVELMANSDNVLRAGCTTKRVDVEELARILHYDGVDPTLVRGDQDGAIRRYRTRAVEFELCAVELSSAARLRLSEAPAIVLAVGAAVRVRCLERDLDVPAGEALFVEGGPHELTVVGAGARAFIASLPDAVRLCPAVRRVWVDADSCPRAVREILTRGAQRRGYHVCFVAAQVGEATRRDAATHEGSVLRGATMPNTAIAGVSRVQPVTGTVDDFLIAHALPGDVVITRDIPLAERLVGLGVDVLNDRGTLFDADTVRERRSMRDAAAAIRAAGLERMGGRSWGARETKAFADAFDRYLNRAERL